MDVHAYMDELLADARKDLDRRRALQEEIRRTEVSCRSPDRSVEVVQTCAGEVRSVRISPGAFDRHDEVSLGRLIDRTIRQAAEAAAWARHKLTEESEAGRRD